MAGARNSVVLDEYRMKGPWEARATGGEAYISLSASNRSRSTI